MLSTPDPDSKLQQAWAQPLKDPQIVVFILVTSKTSKLNVLSPLDKARFGDI